MTALGEVGTKVEVVPNPGIKLLEVVTPDTVIGGTDNFTVNLAKYGCSKVHAVWGFDETTAGSVAVPNTCTTAVSSGVLTITTVTVNTCKHVYYIWAY